MADPGRKYCTAVDGGTHFKCNYCDIVTKGGGITRFKYHLSGTDPHRNVRHCTKCPPEVKEEMRVNLEKSRRRKQSNKRKAVIVQDTLHDRVFELDHDRELDEEVQCREVKKRSRIDAHNSRMPSGDGGSSEYGRVSGAPGAPSLHKSDSAAKRRIPEMVDSEKTTRLGKLVSKWIIYDNIPAHKVTSSHFKNMMACVQELGPGVPLPKPDEVYGKYLDEQVSDTEQYVNSMRKLWKENGCTIMADGWTGPSNLTIINFMVYSGGKTVFLKSVDASGDKHSAEYIYKLLSGIVKDIGKENVVQVVTSNAANYKKAGKGLMKTYPLYWTPCAAHCIDLILEDIGKRPSISRTLEEARLVTRFFYNHHTVLAHMREVFSTEIIRPGPTRFATNYLVLKSISEYGRKFKSIFTSDWWSAQSSKIRRLGARIEEIVFDNSFWGRVTDAVEVFEPLYIVLRIVASEVVPTMGMLLQVFEQMKRKLELMPDHKWVLDIVRQRWDKKMRQPLHEAAYFLNPKVQYDENLPSGPEYAFAVTKVFDRLFPNSTSTIGNELIYFRDARGSFSTASAVRGRHSMSPAEWWSMFGHDTLTLRQLAVKLLSQTTSSSACERNWSTFALVHTRARNQLAYNKLEKLVYCSYNMKLRTRDAEADADNCSGRDPLEIIQRSMDAMGVDDTDVLVDWIRLAHLDDDNGNPDESVASAAMEDDEHIPLESDSSDNGDGGPIIAASPTVEKFES